MQFDRLKRRDFIALISGVAAACPLVIEPDVQISRIGLSDWIHNPRGAAGRRAVSGLIHQMTGGFRCQKAFLCAFSYRLRSAILSFPFSVRSTPSSRRT
jgi:hypothetical protein